MAIQTLIRWRGGGVAAVLIGALLMSLLTPEGPLPADEEAKTAALPADLAKIPSDGLAIVSGRVADLWGSELIKSARKKYKKEIDEVLKTYRKRFGLPLEQVERMTLGFASPPPYRGDEALFFVRTVKPYDLAQVVAATKNVKARKYKGETLYVGDKDWTIYPLDDQSLVYGQLAEMRGLIDHPQPKTEGRLAAALRLAAGKHSAVYGINVKSFYEWIGGFQLPGEVEPFLPLLEALSATLTVDFAADSRAEAVLTFATEKGAKAAVKPAQTGLVLLRAGLEQTLMAVSNDKDGADLFRTLKQFQQPLKATRIEQKGTSLRAAVEAKIDAATVSRTLGQVVRKMRDAASRSQGQNNLHQISLAMHYYADTMRGRLPAHAVYDKNGKPLLSWRVLILPYIEQQNLYNQFHLNEPWDSEHNKKLLAWMPKIYASPQDSKTVKEHTTYYQAFVGKGAFFEGKQGLRFPADFPDGTVNTFMIVEASKAVPWSKPEDIPYDPKKPLPKLGLPGAAGFLAALCDGSVRFCSHKISPKTLRLVIDRNDGMPIPADF